MLPIEEIFRISGIKGKCLESGKGSKYRARPFPTISHEIGDAEVAGALGERSGGNRVPALKIKIAVPLGGCLRAPRISAVDAAASAACSAMPFRFARQFLPCPARIGRCFIVADVHRPVERQRDLRKHGAIAPGIPIRNPKRGMGMSLRSNPCPPGIAPK